MKTSTIILYDVRGAKFHSIFVCLYLLQPKIWIVKEMAVSRSPITVKRNFAVKRRKKLIRKKRFAKLLITSTRIYVDIERQTPKQLS